MDLITVRDLFKNTEKYAGTEVNVGGWVRNRRGSKQFGFIVLNDGTYFTPVQVVYNDTLENFQEISKINIGAALIVRGTLVLTPDSKQPFEIQAEQITVEGSSTGDYPLQPKRHSMEFLRTINHLRPRTNTFQAVFRVRSLAAMAIHQFFQDRDFVYVHTPLITGSDCEGAGEMFQVTTLDLNNVPKTEDGKVDYTQDFFGKPTNLTVSGQLNAETFAMAFRNVYTFGPTFRAENSNTTRHAAEFWMIEPEIAFADLEDDMELAEAMIKYIISYVLEHAPEEMNFFNEFVDKGLLDRLHNVLHNEFGRITYTDAVALLEKSAENKSDRNGVYHVGEEKHSLEEVGETYLRAEDSCKEQRQTQLDKRTYKIVDAVLECVEIFRGTENRFIVLKSHVLNIYAEFITLFKAELYHFCGGNVCENNQKNSRYQQKKANCHHFFDVRSAEPAVLNTYLIHWSALILYRVLLGAVNLRMACGS